VPIARYILVSDDIPEQRQIYVAMLEYSGFQVLEAPDGGTTLRLAKAHLPNVILLDLRMPDMSGREVARLLKDDPRTAHIRIVMVSADASEDARSRAGEAGCDAFVAKPASPREILAVVQDQIILSTMV
jgi:two-component system cell cycle response regulator DivK